MKILLLSAVCAALPITMSLAAETRFESGPQQTALVELYTSEGCSSCPPAEAWLSRLTTDSGLWKKFVPIAFHVDYWDRLGWPDRFASQQWTKRQRRYAALWQSESVYTPAVVLNGRELSNWSGANLAAPNDKAAGLLVAKTSDGKKFVIEFRPTNGVAGNWEAHLALLASGISSKIRAGENSGRNLQHDFVVLGLRDAVMAGEGEAKHASLTIPAASESGARPAVAIWVSSSDRLAPVQATGGWLP
ncbi:MAG: DUF1223 domain-containing protein [Chthoniobacterales bacterium]